MKHSHEIIFVRAIARTSLPPPRCDAPQPKQVNPGADRRAAIKQLARAALFQVARDHKRKGRA